MHVNKSVEELLTTLYAGAEDQTQTMVFVVKGHGGAELPWLLGGYGIYYKLTWMVLMDWHTRNNDAKDHNILLTLSLLQSFSAQVQVGE
jgi:hypothetical protein